MLKESSQKEALPKHPFKRTLSPILTRSPIAFLASFPPRECGIATFTADLAEAVDNAGLLAQSSQVIAVNPGGRQYSYGSRVRWTIERDDLESYRRAARAINRSRVQLVSIQHEYGLFGGEYGGYLLAFLRALDKPVTLTMHTVLEHPDPAMQRVTEELAQAVSSVVVLAERARTILSEYYPRVDTDKVHFIPHGTPEVPYAPTAPFKKVLGLEGRTVLATFGLLGPDKGIEYALDALPAVLQRHPDLLYLVLGETHPELRRHSGESYREFLMERVAELGLQEHVRFYKRYLDRSELVEFLQATDIYVIPYLNPYQIASGTLSYAVASGKAVVSTPFVHAQELLSEGRGLLARFRDSASLAVAMNTLLDQPALRAQMERAAYNYGKRMHWSSVGRSYCRLFQRLVGMPTQQRRAEITSPAASLGLLRRRSIAPLPLGPADFPGRSVASSGETSLVL
ncbi:MAG TPA: glycosyltransferase family 4 protein [Ktedonobacterales bacterium]|nr:glycosyltransferase family 4 protein [Ktedonobacterales bacterium]